MTCRNTRMRLCGLCFAALVPLTGCNDLVLENLTIGLRDGALSAADGLIHGLFDQHFGLEEEGEDAEHGNDLHVHP